MADRKKGSRRSVTAEQRAMLDRVATRVRGKDGAADRVVAFVDRNAQAEALETYIVLQLKEGIERSGLTGYALAKRTGLAQSTVSKFLNGEQMNLTIETLARLCVELDLIVLLEPKPNRNQK